MIMEIPERFRQLAGLMHQDIFLDVKTEDELFSDLAKSVEERGRSEVVMFIDELLASDLTGRELSDIWADAGADWVLLNDTARAFLERLRDEIARRVE